VQIHSSDERSALAQTGTCFLHRKSTCLPDATPF
jgi:hypothetical protein